MSYTVPTACALCQAWQVDRQTDSGQDVTDQLDELFAHLRDTCPATLSGQVSIARAQVHEFVAHIHRGLLRSFAADALRQWREKR